MKWIDVCCAAAGIASPVVLATATVMVAWPRQEYSHLRNTLSELGMVGAPGAVWMNAAGIVPAGFLVTASALAVYRAFGGGALSMPRCSAVSERMSCAREKFGVSCMEPDCRREMDGCKRA